MCNKKQIQKFTSVVTLFALASQFFVIGTAQASNKIVYPLKTISKLHCRFNKTFQELEDDCKQQLPILKTADYKKYAKQGGGYNDFTRLYTVLWGASYKYGWDVGFGGHMGTDIATAEGTPIYSIADGEVIIAQSKAGLGKMVAIKHQINGKTIVSNYGHMSKIIAKKGQKVRAGDLIGEVGSTGYSTGNHLHFQIDIKTNYSPIYFSSKTCPYSYYEITEKGVCFDELQQITVDPLKFIETQGEILNKVKVKTEKISRTQSETPKKQTEKKKEKVVVKKPVKKDVQTKDKIDTTVFNRTVYTNYDTNDIKEVQKIYKELGYYNGSITGIYSDVEGDVIRYQLDRNVIPTRNSDGAGWFGPKTRAQTKKDYLAYKKTGNLPTIETISEVYEPKEETTNSDTKITIENDIPTEKISRKQLLSREEIQAREVKSFLEDYNLDLEFKKTGKSSVGVGATEILKLHVTNYSGKDFKGIMPGNMTFVTDNSKLDIIPKKLSYFTDGKREIKITGLKEGTTDLHIKVGETTIKTFKIKVYNGNKTIYPAEAKVISPGSAVIGEKKVGFIIMQDKQKNKLINIPYGSTFTLTASQGDKVCIKRGTLKNIKKVINTKCDDREFKNEVSFNYDDTLSGLVVFEYKATSTLATFQLVNQYNQAVLGTTKVSVKNFKDIPNTYSYSTEVNGLVKKHIATGIKQGYFQKNKNLTKKEAYTWIRNSLQTTGKTQKLAELNTKIDTANYGTISRMELAELAYDYLIDEKSTHIVNNYKDLTQTQNTIANTIFKNGTTWKDKFGESYFQPNEKITRGESAYLLYNTLQNNTRNISFK